jgi:hypothetical protein
VPGRWEGLRRLKKRLVDGLKQAGTDYYVFDTDTIGFAVRVRATRRAAGEVPRVALSASSSPPWAG